VYSGEIKRLLANDSFSEGVDTTKVRVLIDANWTMSDTSVSQKGGRNRRTDEGKAMGVIVNFVDEWGELARRERVLVYKTAQQEVPEELARQDDLYRRSLRRLQQYRDRKWPVTQIDDAGQINFEEIRSDKVSQLPSGQQELELGLPVLDPAQ
jgi:superfamily II DNA/RNA helicase